MTRATSLNSVIYVSNIKTELSSDKWISEMYKIAQSSGSDHPHFQALAFQTLESPIHHINCNIVDKH